jgi:fatty-acyl-CoA synthase
MNHAYARGAQTASLLENTIGANLDATVARWPEREALVSCAQGVRMSWREFGAAVDELARGLIAAGLTTGDRLGVWSPNRYEWTLVQYATAKLGVILVNINPAYRTSELEYALRQSGCRMLIAADAFKTSDYVAMVGEVRPGLDDLERVVFLGGPEWDELLAGAASVDPARVEEIGAALSNTDPINIQYTSGTTGFPGALLPLLRNGDGQPRVHLARRHDGDPGSRLRSGGDAGRVRAGALHLPVRGPDDVHRDARRAGLRLL